MSSTRRTSLGCANIQARCVIQTGENLHQKNQKGYDQTSSISLKMSRNLCSFCISICFPIYFGNLLVYDRKIIEFLSYAFLTVSKAIFYSKLTYKSFPSFSFFPLHLGHLQKEILKNFTEPNMHLTFITVHVMSVVR